MLVQNEMTTSFVVKGIKGVDPIHVTAHDYGKCCGRLTIICYGLALNCFWPGMGEKKVLDFFADCEAGYVLQCFERNLGFEPSKHQTKCILKIIKIAQNAVKKLKKNSLKKPEDIDTIEFYRISDEEKQRRFTHNLNTTYEKHLRFHDWKCLCGMIFPVPALKNYNCPYCGQPYTECITATPTPVTENYYKKYKKTIDLSRKQEQFYRNPIEPLYRKVCNFHIVLCIPYKFRTLKLEFNRYPHSTAMSDLTICLWHWDKNHNRHESTKLIEGKEAEKRFYRSLKKWLKNRKFRKR